MQERHTHGTSVPNVNAPAPRWHPLCAYNDLPPIPPEELTSPAVETQCETATEALERLRETTDRLSDPMSLFETTALIEAQASSAIEGIVTNVDEMLKHLGRPRLSNGEDPEVDSALRHHDAIVDAWLLLDTEPIGTTMATLRAVAPGA